MLCSDQDSGSPDHDLAADSAPGQRRDAVGGLLEREHATDDRADGSRVDEFCDLAQLFVKSIEAPDIRNEHGVPFQVFYGISGNTRRQWSIANAQRVIGYVPEDDSEVVYAEEIGRHLTGPARSAMVQGEARGGKGHR